MSYEDSNERRRSRSGFRTTLDLGMGIFYVAIGILVITYKAFANVAIPPVIAYLLGGMMLVGGCFRFYNGYKSFTQNRKR